jgi:DNA mismatch repair protein MutS2
VHGKGEGILQKGIHEYLRDAPAVAGFAFAVPEDGGSGKTRVSLKG